MLWGDLIQQQINLLLSLLFNFERSIMVYYLRAVYEGDYTSLGTWGNDVFKGKSLKRKLTNFRKIYEGRKNFSGHKIIGVEVETCDRTYSRPIDTKKIYWE
jgi:hypothetical protein